VSKIEVTTTMLLNDIKNQSCNIMRGLSCSENTNALLINNGKAKGAMLQEACLAMLNIGALTTMLVR